jgi:vitamin B12 transporter
LYSLATVGEYKKDKLNSHFTLATNQDDAESSGQGESSRYTTNRYVASWDNLYAVSDILSVVGGAEWYEDKVKVEGKNYTQTDRDNAALYVGSYLNKGDFSAESNFRWDDNSAYGTFWTYQFGLGYQLTESLKAVGLYGTSFKAPTFNQLYYPLECGSYGCYQGNANLVPEETESSEIALEGNFELLTWRLAGHYSEVDKMIASNGTTNVNVNKAEIKGVEVSGQFDTGPLAHNLSYDYLDTKDKSTGNELVRRAKHSAKWNMTYLLDAWRFDVSYLYQGKRYDDAKNTKELDPYSLVDIATSYYFDSGVTLSGKIGNVFDEDYETALGYKTQDRNYYASIAYQF